MITRLLIDLMHRVSHFPHVKSIIISRPSPALRGSEDISDWAAVGAESEDEGGEGRAALSREVAEELRERAGAKARDRCAWSRAAME